MKIRLLILGLLSFAAGWTIWFLSPAITGAKEPWDASLLYLPTALFLCGLVLSIIAPRYYWVPPIGLYVGQLGFMITQLERGALIVVGVGFLAVFTLTAFAGGAITLRVSEALRKRRAAV